MDKRISRLKQIFNPKTIAVIGATPNKDSAAYYVFKNIVGSEYEGVVYPVNLTRKSVLGVKAYPDVLSLPEKIDLVIIATPAKTVKAIVEQCCQVDVGGIVMVTAGFEEDEDRKKDLTEIITMLRDKGIPMIGPNCLGFVRPPLSLNASFSARMPKKGKVAFISQSGALGTSIIDWAISNNVGMDYFVSIGQMEDIGFHDLIDYFGNDPQTSSILIYMESVKDARRFMSAARAFARSKPIIMLKSGRSKEGSKAAASHTGSIAGDDRVFDAAFKRAGAVRVRSIQELFDCTKALSMQKRPNGNRIAIVTNAGGPGVIATDTLIQRDCILSDLSSETMNKLNQAMPPMWSHANPIDVLGDADHKRFKIAIELCVKDPNVDGIIIILTPQAMTHPDEVAKAIAEIPDINQKTILAVFMGESEVVEGTEILTQAKIPVYKTPEDAVKAFAAMHQHAKNIDLLYETPANVPHAFEPKTEENKKIIRDVISQGRTTLTEAESKILLKNYDIPVLDNQIATSEQEAISASETLGYPLVMKILSPDILHKTDVGGVKVGIENAEEAKAAYNGIMFAAKQKVPDAKIDGVLIEPMQKKKYELLIGSKKDKIFGPVIVFGMGGIAVEVFADTNVGLPPLNMTLAARLIEETKIYSLLKGYRNMPGVDVEAIQFLLYKFAYFVMDFPQIKEIDINPFAVDTEGGFVLDAKIVLDESLVSKGPDYEVPHHSHLVISPYPKHHNKQTEMKNGRTVILRPIRPEDEPLEAEMFTKFSEETQRYRFFTRISETTHEMLVRYTQIDYDREIAIVAEVEEDGKKKMAGVARLIEEPYREKAEFAIVVADPWHGQGLGNLLMDFILQIAAHRKIKKVYAYFLPDNFIMKHMFERRGFRIEDQNDSFYSEKTITNTSE